MISIPNMLHDFNTQDRPACRLRQQVETRQLTEAEPPSRSLSLAERISIINDIMIIYISGCLLLTSGSHVLADVVLLQTFWLSLCRVYNEGINKTGAATLPDPATANSSADSNVMRISTNRTFASEWYHNRNRLHSLLWKMMLCVPYIILCNI